LPEELGNRGDDARLEAVADKRRYREILRGRDLLRTGRTPIPAPRLMLHAWKLEHASIGVLEAPIPIDFAA